MSWTPPKADTEATSWSPPASDSPVSESVSIKDALFPRVKTAKNNVGSKAIAALLDVMADAAKVPAASASIAARNAGFTSDTPKFGHVPSDITFSQALQNMTEGKDEYGNPSIINRIGSSPAFVPSLVSGMGAAGLAEGALPALGASTLGRIALGGVGGAAQGLTSGTINQANSASQGNGFNPKEIGKEALITGGTGVGLGALGEGAKAVGSQIVKSALKPGFAGQKEGFDVANVFKNNLGGTFKQMTTKVEAALTKLRGQQSAAVQGNATAPVNVGTVYADLVSDLKDQVVKGKAFGDTEIIRSTLKSYADDLTRLASRKGITPLEIAHEIKKKAGEDAAMYFKAARTGGDKNNLVKQKIAAMFSRKLGEAIGDVAPEVNAPNKEFTEIIPIAKTLARRNVIAGQHNPIGLDEVAALDAGTQLATTGTPEGLIIPLMMRALKMPSTGNALYQGGKRLTGPVPRTLAGMVYGATK